MGYRFYNQPQLGVGTVAPDRIEAPRNGHFEDPRTTEERRKAIRTGVVPILERNTEITAKTEQNLAIVVDRIEQLRQVIGAFPFVEVKILSFESQKYLRSSSEATWQSVLAALERILPASLRLPLLSLKRRSPS